MAITEELKLWKGTGQVVLEKNGMPRVYIMSLVGASDFSAVWDAEGIAPAGTLSLSFDGNPGIEPAVLDMATGDNAYRSNIRLPFVDVEVTGLPPGGKVIFYAK